MSRSEYTVPKWDLGEHQRQEEEVGAETEANRNSSDMHSHQKSFNHLVHMSSYDEIAELGWENGQPSRHEHVKVRMGDTLESIVNQATRHSQKPQPQNINLSETEHQHNHQMTNKNTIVTSSTRTWGKNLSNMEMNHPVFTKKRGRSPEYYDHCGGLNNYNSSPQEQADMRSCASASAAFCRDNDTTMVTWPSLESPRNVKTKPAEEDSACHAATENLDEEFEIKGEKVRSGKRTRTAAVHNQSERNRRDRINQKMKSLQKLVPNANKTDKASMLDEVIEHIKQLQTLIQMMGAKNIPQMMPLAMQQQLQMPLVAQMGMGVGLDMNMGSGMHMGTGMNMGHMFDMTTFLRAASQPLSPLIHPNPATMVATSTFIPPQLLVPSMIPRNIQSQASAAQYTTNTSPVPFSDPYSAFLAQSINMKLCNKMEAAVHQQQVNQVAEAPSGALNSKHMQ